MPNNLHSYQILLVSSLGFFLGTFFAISINTIFQARFKNIKFTKYRYRELKDAFLSSTAMGILASCSALATGSVERGYLESFSLLSIFTDASDTWLKVIKLIFVKVTGFGNTQQP